MPAMSKMATGDSTPPAPSGAAGCPRRGFPITADDGLSGKEGSFLICSFWLVSALTIVGEMRRALDLMTRLIKVASPLGLYAEEYEVSTGRHLGNFPQAFSHLALLDAALRIILVETLGEF